MTIHVYHPNRQPAAINYCMLSDTFCSHLCLPSPQMGLPHVKVSCACPSGWQPLSDGKKCSEQKFKTTTKLQLSPVYRSLSSFAIICIISSVVFSMILIVACVVSIEKLAFSLWQLQISCFFF